MVGKLFKHEFIALGRIILPAIAVIFSIVFLFSFTLLLPSNALKMLEGLLSVLFAFAFLSVLFTLLFCIYRFQKSIFSKEGYLTLSLPIEPMQLILVKAVASVVVINFSALAALLSAQILSAVYGENVFGLIVSTISNFLCVEGEAMIGIMLYLLFFILIAEIAHQLFIYACISSAQLFNEKRSELSGLYYIGIGFMLAILFSFMPSVIFGILPVETPLRVAGVYLIISVCLVQFLLLGIGSAFVFRNILKKKINLLAYENK